jgi:Helix-turn-helix of DDE superfamily endonuclease
MQLTYDKLSQQPRVFLKLTGVSLDIFNELVKRLEPSFEQLAAQKLLPGRTSRLVTNADKLLCVLIYYRTYITHTFIGYLFNLHNSNICMSFNKENRTYAS